MGKRVIADCGSTKIHWAVVEGNRCYGEFFTTGINPVVMAPEMIAVIFEKELPGKLPADLSTVEFYGAGCKGEAACGAVRDALAPYAGDAVIVVESDMLGVCRALLGDREGVACILGTGANSCLYDGRCIISNVSPGGYILGDEGSGAWLGRRFAGDFIKGLLPADLAARFVNEYGLDAAEIIRRVYRPQNGETAPNRFLASFATFINANIGDRCMKEMVTAGFSDFFARNVAFYFDSKEKTHNGLTVNFAGSVAYAFEPLLREVGVECGYEIGMVVKNPMEAMLRRICSF